MVLSRARPMLSLGRALGSNFYLFENSFLLIKNDHIPESGIWSNGIADCVDMAICLYGQPPTCLRIWEIIVARPNYVKVPMQTMY